MFCKDCEHWDSNMSPYVEKPENSGLCKNVKPLWEATKLSKLCQDDDAFYVEFLSLNENDKDKKAFSIDGEQYYAGLVTLSNFGCVDFKNKELKNGS